MQRLDATRSRSRLRRHTLTALICIAAASLSACTFPTPAPKVSRFLFFTEPERDDSWFDKIEDDMVMSGDDANTLALAYLESQSWADAADPAIYLAAQDAIQLALQHTSADVSDLTTDLHVLDDTDAIATAKVQVDRSGLRSAEEVIEQFNRVTKRTVHVRLTAKLPSQAAVDRQVARALRSWGRLGGRD